MRAKHQHVMRDIEHKISRAVVDVAFRSQAATIVIGDVRDIADGVDQGKVRNQQASQWNHGKIRQYITYKAAAEGMAVELVDELYLADLSKLREAAQTARQDLFLRIVWFQHAPRRGGTD